jgi:hypothetical protein
MRKHPGSCLIALLLICPNAFAAAARSHSVSLGAIRRVPYVAPDVSRDAKEDEAMTLRVRSLVVDGKAKEWVTGEIHEVTERSFVVRRVLHVNDMLPGERAGRWVWQPGPWLLVDRVSGRIAALHLPDFDASISEVAWYRDYAAYCGVHTTAKGSGLSADVWQIGARRAALSAAVGRWPAPERVRPVCAPAIWQREPMRVTLQATGADPVVYVVVGTSSQLVEDGEGGDDDRN